MRAQDLEVLVHRLTGRRRVLGRPAEDRPFPDDLSSPDPCDSVGLPDPGDNDSPARSLDEPMRTSQRVVLDALLNDYVDWRPMRKGSPRATARWPVASGAERALRFAAYIATLDQEQPEPVQPDRRIPARRQHHARRARQSREQMLELGELFVALDGHERDAITIGRAASPRTQQRPLPTPRRRRDDRHPPGHSLIQPPHQLTPIQQTPGDRNTD